MKMAPQLRVDFFFFLKREEDMDNKIMNNHGDGTKVAKY